MKNLLARQGAARRLLREFALLNAEFFCLSWTRKDPSGISEYGAFAALRCALSGYESPCMAAVAAAPSSHGAVPIRGKCLVGIG